MTGKEIRTVTVRIGVEDIPEYSCVLCDSPTEKVFLEFGIPDRNPVIKNSLPTPGYRCLDSGCGQEFFETISTTLPILQAMAPVLEEMQKRGLAQSIRRRIAWIEGKIKNPGPKGAWDIFLT